MSPPPRRNAGKGRGRGGRGGDRRPSADRSSISISNSDVPSTSSKPPKKRERGNSSSSGGGKGRPGPSTSSAASARPTRAVTTVLKKLVVRNIPPAASEQEARALLQAHGVGDEFVWRFVPGRQRSGNRAPTPARLYVDMKKDPEGARKLVASLHGQPFHPEVKDAPPLDVEFAPFQKVPREKQRKDAKVGTIDRDPEFVAFLEELAKPKDKLPSAEAVVDMAEGETVEKPVAALVKYLNERKVHSRDKGKGKSGGKSLDKSARRQKGKKEGSKQKSIKDKSKTSKDRQKKTNGEATNAQDSTKNRKQRGRTAPKKDSAKQESTKPEQPGMLRIMTPKSASASAATGDSTPASAAKSNGATTPAEAPSERGSEKRAPKPGKKNGGRGRNNPKKGKDGDGADGEAAGKTDVKPHQRRKGGNSGKKEPSNKGERKKKVFAPKDATAQGTAAKS